MRSLSARLLVLTAFFVMLVEVLIFVPSVARFRMDYLENCLASGYLATLALEASPTGRVDSALTGRLLARVGAHAVMLQRRNGSVLMLDSPAPPRPDARINLAKPSIYRAIVASLQTLFDRDGRVLRVEGPAPGEPGASLAVVIDEAPLRAQMWNFGRRIFALSIVISLSTAALVYFALQWLLVRPMRRITANMTLFRDGPEDALRRIRPSRRRDEIGRAERELAMLQETVGGALGQRARLAALGTAITKINHDLRSILATARLVTDGLSASAAPEVRRAMPRLVDAIDRAVLLCTQTLDFSRDGAPPIAPSRFLLAALLEEVAADLGKPAEEFVIEPALPADLVVEADRAQLYRVLSNLARNALEAGARRLRVTAAREAGIIAIDIADDGPGLPPKAVDNLFRPFFGSARPGGSGLGLAIARELMRLHGGDLDLVSTTGAGTAFRLTLPAPAPVSRVRRSAS